MILDEVQVIKSLQSFCWKSFLGFYCCNRLLFIGMLIQNNMQELWVLLYFIMFLFFDLYDEFSEWFLKDIELYVQSNIKFNEDQLKCLYMIFKFFMFWCVKKYVQKEFGDKIELDVFCDFIYWQCVYYCNFCNQINIMDFVEKVIMGDEQDLGQLMNFVMQFCKVCNYFDFFECVEVILFFLFGYFVEIVFFVREGNNVVVGYFICSLIDYEFFFLVWFEGG